MTTIKQFVFSHFDVNTYLVIDDATKETAVVDPAMIEDYESKEFDDYVKVNGLKITQIINTHLHLDHCFGMEYVKDKYGVSVKAHSDDAPIGQIMRMQYQMFGMSPASGSVTIDVPLRDGDVIQLGETRIEVIHVPGHSPGGISLYIPAIDTLISGDSLFHGSIGRTDLPGGNYHQLINAVSTKLFSLPDDTKVLPGHGDSTTIKNEKAHNPFFK